MLLPVCMAMNQKLDQVINGKPQHPSSVLGSPHRVRTSFLPLFLSSTGKKEHFVTKNSNPSIHPNERVQKNVLVLFGSVLSCRNTISSSQTPLKRICPQLVSTRRTFTRKNILIADNDLKTCMPSI